MQITDDVINFLDMYNVCTVSNECGTCNFDTFSSAFGSKSYVFRLSFSECFFDCSSLSKTFA